MIVATICGYWFIWITISFILAWIGDKLKQNLNAYMKYILIQPVLIIAIPLAVYFISPTHSIPFSIFLMGRIMYDFYGVRDTSDILNTSAFQRHYGGIINVLSWLLSMIGIGWGAYNLFIK